MTKPLLTKEQENFVKQNVLNTSNKDLTNLVNSTFNLSLSCGQLKSWKKHHHIKSNLTGRFPKNHIPWNKNKPMPARGRSASTQFKKGCKPPKWRPVGSTITRSDGYTYTKIKSEGTQKECWKLTHRLLWEKEHGPIPAGYVLVFLDQDTTHISLDNLALVSKADCMIANKNKLLFADKELTYSGLQITKLLRKTSQLKNKRKKAASIKPTLEEKKSECQQVILRNPL